MLKDIKFLKSKLEEKFKLEYIIWLNYLYSLNPVFGELVIYVNSWYYSESEFIKYIKETVNYNPLTIESKL